MSFLEPKNAPVPTKALPAAKNTKRVLTPVKILDPLSDTDDLSTEEPHFQFDLDLEVAK